MSSNSVCCNKCNIFAASFAGWSPMKTGKNKKERIIIPCFGEEIAPCFSASRRFRCWDVNEGKVTDYREMKLDSPGIINSPRFMRHLDATVILCDGIEGRTSRMLEADGIGVIDNVAGTATDALFGYLAGKLSREETKVNNSIVRQNTADTVAWTRELFMAYHWHVEASEETCRFPVDLMAERECPVCKKKVRVAICCGAHAYRVDQEILEFKHVTPVDVHARVYVHQALPAIENACREYGVELLAPSAFTGSGIDFSLAPLQGHIQGHDRLLQSAEND